MNFSKYLVKIPICKYDCCVKNIDKHNIGCLCNKCIYHENIMINVPNHIWAANCIIDNPEYVDVDKILKNKDMYNISFKDKNEFDIQAHVHAHAHAHAQAHAQAYEYAYEQEQAHAQAYEQEHAQAYEHANTQVNE
jgi:hypothetical protein